MRADAYDDRRSDAVRWDSGDFDAGSDMEAVGAVAIDHMIRFVNEGEVGADAAREDSQEKLVEGTLYLALEKHSQTLFYMT